MVAPGAERSVPSLERLPLIRTEALVALLAIQSCGSISRAAAMLGEPKSSLSRRMSELERSVGTPLLKRDRSGVALTEAGREVHARAQQLMELLDRTVAAAQSVASEPRGDLIVSVPHLLAAELLLPALPGFLAAHPDMRLRILPSRSAAGEADPTAHVSVCVGHLPDVDMVKRRIGRSELAIFAAPACATALNAMGDPSTIAHPAMLGSPRTGNCHRVIGMGPEGPALRAEIGDPHLRYRAVRCGIGAAWLPAFLCREDVAAGRIVRVAPAISFRPVLLHALYPAHLAKLVRVRLFVDFLKRSVGALTE